MSDESAHTSPDAAGAAWLPDAWWRLSLRARQLTAGLLAAVLVLGLVGLVWQLGGDGAGPDGSDSAGAPAAGAPVPSGAEAFVASLPPDRIAVWDALAGCEAQGDWSAVSAAGHYGGLQFTERSWRAVGGSGLPHEHPREEQILRAELLRSIQGWDAWPSCAQQLGL